MKDNKHSQLIGIKFNMLTVVGHYKGNYYMELLCKCDCGKIKHYTKHQLTSNKVKSCGCYSHNLIVERNFKHGQGKKGEITSEYKAWSGMKERCYNEKYYLYHRYGGERNKGL